MAAPSEGDPSILLFPNFSKFYLFIFANPENLMCLAWVVKKLEFCRFCLRGTQISVPQILSNFIFPLYSLTLQILYVQLKKFEIWNALFEENSQFFKGLVDF